MTTPTLARLVRARLEAEQEGSQVILKHLPGQHDQLDHGRRYSGYVPPLDGPQAFSDGAAAFLVRLQALGTTAAVEQQFESIPLQLRLIQHGIAVAPQYASKKWAQDVGVMHDKFMQTHKALVEQYGMPVVLAGGELTMEGSNAKQEGILGQTFAGSMVLFDPEHGLLSVEQRPLPGGTQSWGSGDTVLRHEYGHWVLDQAQAPREDNPDVFSGNGPMGIRHWNEEALKALMDKYGPHEWNERGLGMYAAQSPHELFAEAFTVVTSPGYDETVRGEYADGFQEYLDHVAYIVLGTPIP